MENLKVEDKKRLLLDLLKKRDAEESFEASAAQAQLYAIWRLDRESAAYNMPLGIAFQKEVDASSIRRALGSICARHSVLRGGLQPISRFHLPNTIAIQLAVPPRPRCWIIGDRIYVRQ